jgi:penicillin-binding protein 2
VFNLTSLLKDFYNNRKYVIQGIILLIFLIYLGRLFYIQIVDDSYKTKATSNVIRKVTLYPSRGLIYDRNGHQLVVNNATYDLMVTPARVNEKLDTASFCRLLNIDRSTFNKKMREARQYSRYKSSIFLKQISTETYTRFQEHLFKYPGFFGQVRTIRSYPHQTAAHMLGYIGEVNEEQVEQSEEYYEPGDYVGVSGLEKEYESQLRGRRGVQYVMVDVHNREKKSFQDGAYDTAAVSGSNLTTTLDLDLQQYGEKLMQNKVGSVVALNPETGGVLAMVSSPTYDPNLLTGRNRGDNFNKLLRDTLNPLFNRPVMASYPPGSTFKPVMALLGLEEHVISPNTGYKCNKGYYVGNFKVGCHKHPRISSAQEAIQHSCNAYFCHVFREVIDQQRFNTIQQSLDHWADYLYDMGFGRKLNIDLPNESAGFVPTSKLYDRIYEGHQWRSLMVVSLGIGQGEMGATPLQMANVAALIANRGHYYTPHIAKSFSGYDSLVDSLYGKKHKVDIDSTHFNTVVDGMRKVVKDGTGSFSQINDITFCGKTGTAENPHGDDHSIFISFAPKDDPQIAIAAFVENAGYGSTTAAPIASLMTEKYLNDTIADTPHRQWFENRILESDFIHKEGEEE